MSCHFTYAEEFERDHLRQGDLLRITDYLKKVLKKYHRHYIKKDYRYFMVLTQSCDLVRRKGNPCNANYITLAAVRPFDLVIQREVEKIQVEDFEKKAWIARSNKRSRIEEFTKKVLNNNHHEFFYLHEDNLLNFSEPCCAFLRLSIAIRSSEHYDKCLEAKFLELTDEYRAKLGWLVGNLYSRIGTKDWAPDYKTEPEFKKIILEILERLFVWLPPDNLATLQKQIAQKQIDISQLSPEEIHNLALSIQLPSKDEKKEAILKSIEKILKKSNAIANDVDLKDLLFKIGNDPTFKANIK